MMQVSRTIFSSYIQTCLLTGLSYAMALNSTLNELFGVENGIAPPTTPTLGYFAIGNGGHKMTVGANNIPLITSVQHKGTDAALFNHLPFILREIGNDLSAGERSNYALRRIETHNGLQYVAYYLKRLPLVGVVPDMELITVVNGAQSVSVFNSTSANLNPTPSTPANTGVNVVSGDYVAASAKINITLSAADIVELLNVATIIYGDSSYAIISEIALCSGVDKMVQSPSQGNSLINFNEAIAVQVMSFISSTFALQANSSGLNVLLDIGSSEPVWALN